jgi:Mn2+/Fe2+ NRAMP family transporter
LESRPSEARRFYGVLAVATLVGLALNFVGINPIRALFWSAVINGVVSVPLMVVTLLMAVNPRVMGQFILPLRLRVLGWIATVAMLVASIGLFATLGR